MSKTLCLPSGVEDRPEKYSFVFFSCTGVVPLKYWGPETVQPGSSHAGTQLNNRLMSRVAVVSTRCLRFCVKELSQVRICPNKHMEIIQLK